MEIKRKLIGDEHFKNFPQHNNDSIYFQGTIGSVIPTFQYKIK